MITFQQVEALYFGSNIICATRYLLKGLAKQCLRFSMAIPWGTDKQNFYDYSSRIDLIARDLTIPVNKVHARPQSSNDYAYRLLIALWFIGVAAAKG